MKKKTSKWWRIAISYFLRGLLFVAPLFLTGYVLYVIFNWADGLIRDFFPELFPGAGFLIIVGALILIGFLSSYLFFNPIVRFLESILNRTPVTKLIYTSLKDLFSAFMGDKKKMFSHPVMVMLFKEAGIQKLGFITKDDLTSIGIENMVAVYFPHSYNFSGNLYLVPKENITMLPDFASADAMKFIVSGGVTEIRGTAS